MPRSAEVRVEIWLEVERVMRRSSVEGIMSGKRNVLRETKRIE
jgi:hypothetical protein